jgi:N-acyl-D-aspartate/D-glutamate deacylase
LFEIAPQGLEFEAEVFLGEVDLLSRIALRTGLPVTFAMLQNERNPDSWRLALDKVDATNAAGGNMRPQIAARPFGMMIGWANNNPFTKRPTVVDLVSRLDGEALRAELRKPEVKAAVLAETDLPSDESIQFDGLGPFLQLMLDKIYSMGDTPNYEPSADNTVAALAATHGVDPLEMAYDLLNTADGNAFLMLPFFNYVGGTQDAIYDMLQHPATVSGLSDGGAHGRMICDASIPTYVLSHWARDRQGLKLSLEQAVKCQTHDTAEVVGFHDRGTLAVGLRADINILDMDTLDLEYPRAVDDLPAGGRRLMQAAHGYVATIVNGEITRRNGADTGARPGRLVRSAH